MTMQNLYMSEKDRDFIKKRVIGYENGDIIFREVEGYRKDVLDVKLGKEIILDNMEKKMRLYDVIKQYELFFNQKLKIYDKKYIDGLVDLLDSNDSDYIKKRKELFEAKRKIPLFKAGRNLFKKYNYNENDKEKKLSQTISVFKFSPQIKRTPKRVSAKSMFENEVIKLDAINKAVKLEKERLNSTSKLEKHKKCTIEERLLLRNKLARHRNTQILDIKKDFLMKDSSNSIQNQITNISSMSKSIRDNHKASQSSYFSDSFKENLLYNAIKNEKNKSKKKLIRIFEIPNKNQIIFKKTYSMINDYYKNYKNSQ
jgi:hypothetical protein